LIFILAVSMDRFNGFPEIISSKTLFPHVSCKLADQFLHGAAVEAERQH
jgi:hypothetical protein